MPGELPTPSPGEVGAGWQVGAQCIAGDLAAVQLQCARLNGITQDGISLCRDPSINGLYLGQLWMIYTIDTTTGAGVNTLYPNKTILLQPCDAGAEAAAQAQQLADVSLIWGLGVAAAAGLWAIKQFVFKTVVGNQ